MALVTQLNPQVRNAQRYELVPDGSFGNEVDDALEMAEPSESLTRRKWVRRPHALGHVLPFEQQLPGQA